MRRLFILILFTGIVSPCLAQTYVPEEKSTVMKIAPVIQIKAYAFPPGDVELLDGEFKDAMIADAKYLLKVEPDRLLSQFRSHSGLQPKAPKYGGWESEGLAGHTLGHYLSACALHWASVRDSTYLKRVNYIINELDECQRARKTGYIGAIPKEDSSFYEVSKGNIRTRNFDLNGMWSPWYTVHKVMAGLLDAYIYCGNKKALEINIKMADWAEKLLSGLNEDQVQQMLRCEYGGMNEVLANTYAVTGSKKYLDLSFRFHDKRLLDSLAMGIDVLPGKHSNTQVPKAIGTARRFELTGKKSDFAIADFFWETVVNHHTYAPGGNSNYEYLGQQDKLASTLTDNTMETCNTYNMLKLTRHLFAMNPKSEYMDYYERALYNHILASQNRATGMMCYFVPLRMGTKKEFSDEFETFTCCVGSGMENHVKHGESIYSKASDGGLYVNLFIDSKLHWRERKAVVMQQSDKITINLSNTQTFPVYIRKPGWAKTAALKVNGKDYKAAAKEGYLEIKRAWKNGDVIQFSVPTHIYSESLPDAPWLQAFFDGPVLLAGNLGAKEPDPMIGIPAIVTDDTVAGNFIKKSDITFQPFYSIRDDYYSVYWKVNTTEKDKKEKYMLEQIRMLEYLIDQLATDIVILGDDVSEKDHELKAVSSEAGESHTHKYRLAKPGGSFSFALKIVPDSTYYLQATYWGMDNRGRQFDILVDGQTIASEDLNKYKESKFYEMPYDIPPAFTKGKSKITVTFQPKEKNTAGPVYEVRIVHKK